MTDFVSKTGPSVDFRNAPLGVKLPSDALVTVIELPSVVDTRAATSCHQIGNRRANLQHGGLPCGWPLSTQRLHRIRVPVAGPREAEAGWPRPERCPLLWFHGDDGLLAPMERGAIDSHAMQNRRQLARQSDGDGTS